MRNVALRLLGAGQEVERYGPPLREAAVRAGSHYSTLRPDGDDALVNAAFEVRNDSRQRTLVEQLLAAGRDVLPVELRNRLTVEPVPDVPHEISAQLVEDRRHGRSALPGAAQAREDLEAWERFVRDAEPRGVLELGTGSGAFSRWLAERVDWFRTIDIKTPRSETPGFLQVDVWAQPEVVHGLVAQAPRPFVLYCDNGNKEREVALFAPSLRLGDFLAVHDFGTEIFACHVPASFAERLTFGLTRFYELSAADADARRAPV